MMEGHMTIPHFDRRVGKDEIDDADDEDEPFDEGMKRLTIVAVESLTPEEQLQLAEHLFAGVIQSIRQAQITEASYER